MQVKAQTSLDSEKRTAADIASECNEQTGLVSKPLSIPIVSGTIVQVNAIDQNEALTKKIIKVCGLNLYIFLDRKLL